MRQWHLSQQGQDQPPGPPRVRPGLKVLEWIRPKGTWELLCPQLRAAKAGQGPSLPSLPSHGCTLNLSG